jgi:ribosomal protein S18 acetylase RimI-like enzyme
MAKSENSCAVRPAEAQDEVRWRELWDAYNRFYQREPREEITRHTWARILNPSSPVYAIVAVNPDGEILGIANYVIHEHTSQLMPACYLQDLIVDSASRGEGIGKMLIDWLIEAMKREGWCRLYWLTKESNYRARALYDKYTPHSGFVRYYLNNPKQ